ncbi:MAG: bifunctional 4-hydroxy-2-oxoglutarate aldolase/2-dehydro-3-deoxy-phosphogluconate aldolase [Bacilli bacterium]
MNDVERITENLKQAGVIAILRKLPAHSLEAAAKAVVEGGVQVIEITLDSEGALSAIESLRKQFGEAVLVGAGTVLTKDELLAAKSAGAQFVLSPHLDVSLLALSLEQGLPMIPGILTPTEIVQAEQAGAAVFKLFPAGSLGTGYLKDLLGPFSGRAFIPTGGVTPDNASDFIRAGAVGVGMGGALIDKQAVISQDWEAITRRVQEVISRIHEAARQS